MSAPLLRLPSLDLLRGFVAVGRRMSITVAAQDLCITQSAVSRQIRTLEDGLGVQLLRRGHRSIAFTDEGERLFRSADIALQQLQDAVGALRDSRSQRAVTITCTVGIASLWLLPRLPDFQREHPGVDVRIAASDRLENLRDGGIDLAIRYCPQERAGAGAERLFGETVVPVAHPALGLRARATAAALERQCLLDFDGAPFPWLQWQEWLSSQGWSTLKPRSRLRFNQYDQVIAAAVAGQGIALGRLSLIGPMLADGRLQALKAPRAGPHTSYGYWLVQARTDPRPDVLTAAQWIRGQAQATDPGGAIQRSRARAT